VLDPNYYGDEHDVAVMVEGPRIARRIGEAPALAPWRAEEVLPGPAVTMDADVAAFVRDSLGSGVRHCRARGRADRVRLTVRHPGTRR